MTATLMVIILLAIEIFFGVWALITKNRHMEERGIVRIGELVLFGVLCMTGVLQWGFRYFFIFAVLAVQMIYSVIVLFRKKNKDYKKGSTFLIFFRNALLILFALLPAVIFPQHTEPVLEGAYEVVTAKYTWVDESRLETFANDNSYRSVTVDFWYPENAQGEFPLVIFSHGAFGFSQSNASTCESLAANGYVVASINHKYHAFYDIDTAGNFTLTDMNFINTVMAQNENLTHENEEQEYENSREWLELRMEDESFVLNTILAETGSRSSDISNSSDSASDIVFSLIDPDKIGLIGHSLGGASSAQLGRDRDDVDAVINLDGTLLGERTGYVDEMFLLNEASYPIPLLDIYAQSTYDLAVEYEGDDYANFHVEDNSDLVYSVVFQETGHLNFTDLPIFSPILAKMLGTGEADAQVCIEEMNQLILGFFDYTLKDGIIPDFEKVY